MNNNHHQPARGRALTATIIVIALILVGDFVYQLGKHNTSGENSSKHQIARVGILQYVSHPALNQIHKGVVDGLKKEGFVDGKNIQIFDQNGQADQSKLATMSEQLANKKSDVLVGIATPAAQALANATSSIPIVLGAVTDPVAAGLVKDMKTPGKNITGVSDQPPVTSQIQLGKTLMPQAKTVGMLYSSTEANSKSQIDTASKAASDLGMQVKKFAVPSSNEIAQTVQVMSDQCDFIYIPLDNTIANAMPTVTDEANKKQRPVITSVDTMVRQGGLATIGVNQYQLGLETGRMAAEILKGSSKPANTPVYTFSTGDTIINKDQARKLGIEVPESVLKKAILVNTEAGKQ
ncbi:putative ABC transport system substrate-binding protein [Bifidobacterium commune]|uniref:Putative ABC transport system substrate-binding protein n=1 Tax=Bifidobacterium commune TaxID=1505727 RepID=A0A1C4H371_9BIFI|nr:tryptophan ABC transporter substrate-binding protein [Bifidobacterium commune]MBB2954917.1 putative ABC transport system substrate-binding protein [Bifidobacterium commune]SCC79048.1 putative ABC transport system substrate-binding protein [Bifidobacterium commune]